MKARILKIGSLLLVLILLFSLSACNNDPGPQGEKGEQGDQGATGRGILKTEIINGELWVTYTDDPDNPVKIGVLDENQGTEGLDFFLLPDGTYAVSAGTTKYLNEIIVPTLYNEKKITILPSEAFFKLENLVLISLPDSVTSIGNQAFFRCTKLQNISLPTELTHLDASAFAGCEKLEQITLPEKMTHMGQYAFSDCSSLVAIKLNAESMADLKADDNVFSGAGADTADGIVVTVGAKVKQIPAYLFALSDTPSSIASSPNIHSVVFEENSICTDIRQYAFFGCTSLKEISIPASVTEIGSNALSGCTGLEAIRFGGTQEQWESVVKGTDWDKNTGAYTVYCSDGNIEPIA